MGRWWFYLFFGWFGWSWGWSGCASGAEIMPLCNERRRDVNNLWSLACCTRAENMRRRLQNITNLTLILWLVIYVCKRAPWHVQRLVRERVWDDRKLREIQFRERERERLVVHGATCQYNTSFVCRETQHNSVTHRENLRETQVTSKFLESAGKLWNLNASTL